MSYWENCDEPLPESYDERLHVFYDVGLSLDEVAFGSTITVNPYVSVSCVECGANHSIEPIKDNPCLNCRGSKINLTYSFNSIPLVNLSNFTTSRHEAFSRVNSQKKFGGFREIFVLKNSLRMNVAASTEQGHRSSIANQGSLFSGVRGNVVVSFFDKPHDYILRANFDVIVAFKIDRMERSSGVFRLLKSNLPDVKDIAVRTQAGVVVEDNSMWFVPKLGLTDPSSKSKGRLIVLFLVRSKKSPLPIKLTNLLFEGSPVASVYRKPTTHNDLNDLIHKDSDQHPSARDSGRSPSKATDNGPEPKKRKIVENQHLTNGSVNCDEKKGSSVKAPIPPRKSDEARSNIPKPILDGLKEFIRTDRVRNRKKRHFHPYIVENLSYLPFEDRITCTGALPMKYKRKISGEMSMNYIEYLWSLRDSVDWQNRVLKYDENSFNDDERFQYWHNNEPEINPQLVNRYPEDFHIFDVEDDNDSNVLSEASSFISTGFAEADPEIPKYTLTKMSSSERRDAVTSFLKYHNVPVPPSTKARWFS